MNKLLGCTVLLCILLFSSCIFNNKKVEGNGKFSTEKRTIKNGSKIKLEGNINVIIENGLLDARVETDENLIPLVLTSNDGEWLRIAVKEGVSLHSSKPITVYISTPTISEVKVAGSGNVTSVGKFSSNEKMSFALAGSGNLIMSISSPDLDAAIAGSGTLHLSGETRNLKAKIAGSGGFEGADLKAENVDVHIAGSGDAVVYAETILSASIAGSGSVKYKGNAKVEKHVAGSGEVVKEQ